MACPFLTREASVLSDLASRHAPKEPSERVPERELDPVHRGTTSAYSVTLSNGQQVLRSISPTPHATTANRSNDGLSFGPNAKGKPARKLGAGFNTFQPSTRQSRLPPNDPLPIRPRGTRPVSLRGVFETRFGAFLFAKRN